MHTHEHMHVYQLDDSHDRPIPSPRLGFHNLRSCPVCASIYMSYAEVRVRLAIGQNGAEVHEPQCAGLEGHEATYHTPLRIDMCGWCLYIK